MTSANCGAVLNIRMMLPIIKSGARVPMRKDNLKQALNHTGVVGEANHQLPGLQPIQVAERKGLDLEEDRLTHIAAHPFADLDRVVIVADGKDGIQDRNAQHQEECS